MSALSALLVFLISFMIVAVFFKMPVSFALGTSSLLVLAYGGLSLTPVPQFAFSGLDSFALLAIPFYIFAGVLIGVAIGLVIGAGASSGGMDTSGSFSAIKAQTRSRFSRM